MADITLQITVPEEWQTKTLGAFNTIADDNIKLYLRAKGVNTEYNAKWEFTIAPKSGGESNIEFGERVIRELGKAVVNMIDLEEDTRRYKDEVEAISPPASDVPDDILI